jgi:hypothetical protein
MKLLMANEDTLFYIVQKNYQNTFTYFLKYMLPHTVSEQNSKDAVFAPTSQVSSVRHIFIIHCRKL